MANQKVKVGISIGDLNGIGMEVIIKTLLDNRVLQDFTPIVYGSTRVASYHRKALGINDFSFSPIKDASDANSKKANLVNCWDEEVKMQLGLSSDTAGEYALKSLEAATSDLASGKIDVLVTAPINKRSIQSDKFNFPGHTEYLANMSNVDEALMLMVSDNLRVGVVTGHIPLSEVSKELTKEKIAEKIELMHNSLVRDFGVRKPKIAVLGLNPHAGERGLMGEEEGNIISPAIKKAKDNGMMVFGPYPADGLFGSSNFKNFDGILAMYHDQGLAPFKALSFGSGVNYTAGLPIVRTSPDHGTAFEIAGKGKAEASSFRNAMYLARDIFLNRKDHKELTANPLTPQLTNKD
jgi:4-hydroxythreonine-4-phosphate dehydrogenase